jgi:hypothetical protein
MERMVWNLSVDPNEPDHLYAGTGEAQGQRSQNAATRGGILASRDRGDTWEQIYEGSNTVRSVCVGLS